MMRAFGKSVPKAKLREFMKRMDSNSKCLYGISTRAWADPGGGGVQGVRTA